MAKKVFSFDAETNGLWGQAFAIGAVVYDENGCETKKFYGRCPIEGTVDSWVNENVLPQMAGMPETADSYEALLRQFAEFYMANKEGSDIIVHMGVPVEAKLFLDLHKMGIIGDWDAPYPLIDIAGNLLQAGFDPTSVDKYNADHGISVPMPEPGGTHNPLYDSRAAALCYIDLMK